MARRTTPHIFSNFDGSVSLIPNNTSHLPQQLSTHQQLDHLERRQQHRFTQISKPNFLARFYHLAQRYFSTSVKYIFVDHLKYSELPKNDKAGRLDFFNRIFINFNFRLPTPNHRAIAHTCCHTAIGG